MDYVDRLTALRIDNDIKQETIAKILNVQQSAISKYEKRRAEMTIQQLIVLCKFYEVSADKILGLY